MEETCKKRCGICGAGIAAKHLGSVKIGDADVAVGYCERCNTFVVTIGDGEKPYNERMAEAKQHTPKGWSRRQCEDGSLELKRRVPRRWLWAFPVGSVLLVFCVCAAARAVDLFFANSQIWTAFIATLGFASGILAWICALCRLTARRYRLGRNSLVVESLWLGFIPMCRRTFARTAITIGGIVGKGKDFAATWGNGYDRREFWCGRSKEEGDFIDANLLALGVADAMNEEPLLCGKCGAEFRQDDIDMSRNSLVCPQCGATTEPGNADRARLVRFRMRYRPHGVIDIPGGFELREGRWWNGVLRAALSRYVFVAFVAVPLARLFEKLPAPWVYVPISILLLIVAAAPVYFVGAAIVGRFGVHRITAEGGKVAYFHGIGKIGRRVELRMDSVDGFGVMYRGSVIDNNAAIPKAIGIVGKGKKKKRCIFRDCPPIFYHWVEGWLRNVQKALAEEPNPMR